MKRLAVVTSLALAGAPVAQDTLRVETTLGVFADLVQQVGGDLVEARALAHPREDPHFLRPRPTLRKRVRAADAVVELGMQFEPWLDRLANAAGNPRIRRGASGRIVAGAGVAPLEVPASLSRSHGHVHPAGNPHVWLDPLRACQCAANIADGLARVAPTRAADFRIGLSRFEARIDEALFGTELVTEVGGARLRSALEEGRLDEVVDDADAELGGWLRAMRPLRGAKIVTYHRTWSYFAQRFGLDVVATIEEKPGITPSARHRDHVLEVVAKQGVEVIVLAPYYPRAGADYIAERTGARVVELPVDVGGAEPAGDYFALIDHLVSNLVAALA